MTKFILTFISVLLFAFCVQAECTVAVTIKEAITASTLDYLQRAESKAREKKCDSLYIRMNTPGGSLQSTRLIVEQILASPIPYLCLISPKGGHAGSAGAIILQACHVNGGLEATNIGAATPILGTGQEMPEDLRKKLVNDTVSWIEGVTRVRGRNLEFSRDIVTEAKALNSSDAVKARALDILAENEADFLQRARDRKVLLGERKEEVVQVGELFEYTPDLRYKVLNFIADPEFAYLLFMGSIALLYVEITNPGMIVPGVIGGIGMVFSMIAFHKLDVAWGGLALILLGIAFLILELFIPSFGALGVGGLAAIFFGSIFLFNAEATGYTLPLGLILPVVIAIGAIFLGVGYLALKTLRMKSQDLDSDLASRDGRVISVTEKGHSGQIEIMGETWSFVSEDPLEVGDFVHVTSRTGLILSVKKNK